MAYSDYMARQLLAVARNLAEDVDEIVGERRLVDDILITIRLRANGHEPTVEVARKYAVPVPDPSPRADV